MRVEPTCVITLDYNLYKGMNKKLPNIIPAKTKYTDV